MKLEKNNRVEGEKVLKVEAYFESNKKRKNQEN